MSDLFDDPEIARWTPLEVPFDLQAAQRYLERAGQRRFDGSALQLAITEEDGPPMGEVLLFMHPDLAEIGWALGMPYRGRGLASRAVRVLKAWAAPIWGIDRFRALIEPGNTASRHVALACGFSAAGGPPVLVETRGRPAELDVWQLTVARRPSMSVASEAPTTG
jgi:RimJ/RimL family protein N-acetyltransferase